MKDYRYYIRDFKISDEEYNNIIDDIINEIAYKTNIWKKEFWFDVIPEQKYYDMNALLRNYERDSYSTIVSLPPKGLDTDSLDYSKSIANILDVRLDKYGDAFNEKTIVTVNNNISAIGSDFTFENQWTLKFIGYIPKNKLNTSYFRRYFAIVSIVPNIEQIYDARESIVANAIVAGLRYKTAMMYTDQNDQSFDLQLKKTYEFELNKLIDSHPHIVNWHMNKRVWL